MNEIISQQHKTNNIDQDLAEMYNSDRSAIVYDFKVVVKLVDMFKVGNEDALDIAKMILQKRSREWEMKYIGNKMSEIIPRISRTAKKVISFIEDVLGMIDEIKNGNKKKADKLKRYIYKFLDKEFSYEMVGKYKERIKEIFAKAEEIPKTTIISWKSRRTHYPDVGIYINPEQPTEQRIPHTYKIWYVTETEVEYVKKNKAKYDFDEERDIIKEMPDTIPYETCYGFQVVYENEPMRVGTLVLVRVSIFIYESYLAVVSPYATLEKIMDYAELINRRNPAQFIDKLQKYTQSLIANKIEATT